MTNTVNILNRFGQNLSKVQAAGSAPAVDDKKSFERAGIRDVVQGSGAVEIAISNVQTGNNPNPIRVGPGGNHTVTIDSSRPNTVIRAIPPNGWTEGSDLPAVPVTLVNHGPDDVVVGSGDAEKILAALESAEMDVPRDGVVIRLGEPVQRAAPRERTAADDEIAKRIESRRADAVASEQAKQNPPTTGKGNRSAKVDKE